MRNIVTFVIVVILSLGAYSTTCAQTGKAKATKVNQLTEKVIYTCPMCTGVYSEKPGKCPKCGMDLVKYNEKACKMAYKCPGNCDYKSEKAGKCPHCGKDLVKCDKTKCPASCKGHMDKTEKTDNKK